MRLQHKTAIITGTSSGIGVGIAEAFAREGARLVLCARRQSEGQATAEQLRRDTGADVRFVRCDVADPASVNALVDAALAHFGQIDILVNNAGVDYSCPFDQTTIEDWDHLFNINLRGVFLCIKAVLPHMLERKAGSVVNIASVHSQACMPGAAPYDAAKWGMVGLTKSLAVEYASRGVRFNVLSPGLIDSAIWRDIQDAAENLDACHAHWRANIPMGRVGTPLEIGRAAAFLASDDAAYVTGANLMADGGMTSLLVSIAQYASKPRAER